MPGITQSTFNAHASRAAARRSIRKRSRLSTSGVDCLLPGLLDALLRAGAGGPNNTYIFGIVYGIYQAAPVAGMSTVKIS